MKKDKYTPGPWRYDQDNLNVYENGLLAQTYGHTHNGERLANAQLISAAPEMLEAIDQAILLLELHSPPSPIESDARSVLENLKHVAAKARGEK